MVKFTAIAMIVLSAVALSAPMPGEAEQLAKAERQANKKIYNAARKASKEARQEGKEDNQELRDASRADRQSDKAANQVSKQGYRTR